MSCWLGCISGNTTDLELFGESGVGDNVLDDGGSLVACGAEDSDDFGHGGDLDVKTDDG